MNTYLCELKAGDLILERFYREGESQQDVVEGLELFEWANAEWEVTEEE